MQKTKLIEQYNFELARLEKVENQFKDISRELEEVLKESKSKEEKIVALKVKEQMLNITKEKSQQEKIKFEQKT